MDFKKLEKNLLDAAGKEKKAINRENPYFEIGFDGDKKRLGWFNIPSFSLIEQSLKQICETINGKSEFIFVGMGGSINGIKALSSIFNNDNIHTLDNLDPSAIENLMGKIKNKENTFIIAISKSGTTKETQLLSRTLKKLFDENWENHFLWLADKDAFTKLDSLGWKGVNKYFIQCDGETDIGGRFSSPHTLIFLLPLFLFLDEKIDKLQEIYYAYISYQKELREKAYYYADKFKDRELAYFSPIMKMNNEGLNSWIVQLFQESLGSKKESLAVKTSSEYADDVTFLSVPFDLVTYSRELADTSNSAVSLMCRMYFLEIFIAFYSAFRNINFVNQDFVEKYKETMRKLEKEKKKIDVVESSFDNVIDKVRKNITAQQKFIEIIIYFYPQLNDYKEIKEKFIRAFKDKVIFIFIGSDWNHHSYQAAFSDKHTFYVLLTSAHYKTNYYPFSPEELEEQVNTLKLIASATHLSISEKSILFSITI